MKTKPLSIVTASVGGEFHLLSLLDSGDIVHRMRYRDGNWQAWGRLPKERFVSISAVGVGDELHVSGITGSGYVFHNIRYDSGEWQGWVRIDGEPITEL